MTPRRTVLLALAASVAALSVGACDTVPSNALESCEAAQVFGGHVKTDILFVIDDSQSMAGEQQLLRLALSNFITTLASSAVANDFQIGVTSTAVRNFNGGTQFTGGPSSGVPYPAGVITAIDPVVDPLTPATWGDYLYDVAQGGFYGTVAAPRILAWNDPALVPAFQRNVLVGVNGPWREQPLDAMERALVTEAAAGGKNESFLRPGARLAVIFLSDEDDCSGPNSTLVQNDGGCDTERAKDPAASALTSVEHYASLLQGQLGGEVRDVVIGAVVGVTCSGGVCTNELCGSAYRTPDRILDLLAAFPQTSTTLASICDTNFDAALQQFAGAVMSQTLPLEGDVVDPHLLVVTLVRSSGEQVSCPVALVGTLEAASAGAVYTPSQAGAPASLTFRGACVLAPGDRIDLKVICAG